MKNFEIERAKGMEPNCRSGIVRHAEATWPVRLGSVFAALRFSARRGLRAITRVAADR